jgi:hypothetical protein
MEVLVDRGDEAAKQRMGSVGFALKFGMKLHSAKEGVILQLDAFHQPPVGCGPRKDKTRGLELRSVTVVELVSVAVAFVHDERVV